jgi:hypothetical protein
MKIFSIFKGKQNEESQLKQKVVKYSNEDEYDGRLLF